MTNNSDEQRVILYTCFQMVRVTYHVLWKLGCISPAFNSVGVHELCHLDHSSIVFYLSCV